mmetsp:Transcript_30450/g.86871  ORF Transcript_30450/g.86871 Transcript_30450/m.86871 type:complete len:250 (-) Transcript_30450:777-1526(-)
MASATMTAPFRSSSIKLDAAHSLTSRERWHKAEPPPGTMPSSMAAFVALIASSRRSFLSLSSVSVLAPTLMSATPPFNLASRFRNCSRVYSLFVSSISLCSAAHRCSTRSLGASATTVVASFLTVRRRAVPRSSAEMSLMRRSRSEVINLAPVTSAMSCSMAFRFSPKPGAWIAQQSTIPRSLLTTSVASASFSIVSAMMRTGLAACFASDKIGMSSSSTFVIRWSVTTTRAFEASQSRLSGCCALMPK